MLDVRHQRIKVPITQSNYIIPNFFPENENLTGKTITGITIDFTEPRNAPFQFNISSNDFSVLGAPFNNVSASLAYMYMTLYNMQDEIIFDKTPLNFFSGYNSAYPNPVTGARNGKKRIIPTNFVIDLRKSYIQGTPGFTQFNSIISINFYYK
jgi:hypothetical protein